MASHCCFLIDILGRISWVAPFRYKTSRHTLFCEKSITSPNLIFQFGKDLGSNRQVWSFQQPFKIWDCWWGSGKICKGFKVLSWEERGKNTKLLQNPWGFKWLWLKSAVRKGRWHHTGYREGRRGEQELTQGEVGECGGAGVLKGVDWWTQQPQYVSHWGSSRIPLLEEFRGLDMTLCFKVKHLFSLLLSVYIWWLRGGVNGDQGMGVGKSLEPSVYISECLHSGAVTLMLWVTLGQS